MKYIVIDQRKDGVGDIFTEEFESLETAKERAVACWHHLTDREKRKREIYVLESVNPDENALDHFDGNPVMEEAII